MLFECQFYLCLLVKNIYLRKDLRDANDSIALNLLMKFKEKRVMCKRDQIVTYMNVNALPNNAMCSFSLKTITVGHFLY